jgi:hypothetical protein
VHLCESVNLLKKQIGNRANDVESRQISEIRFERNVLKELNVFVEN